MFQNWLYILYAVVLLRIFKIDGDVKKYHQFGRCKNGASRFGNPETRSFLVVILLVWPSLQQTHDWTLIGSGANGIAYKCVQGVPRNMTVGENKCILS